MKYLRKYNTIEEYDNDSSIRDAYIQNDEDIVSYIPKETDYQWDTKIDIMYELPPEDYTNYSKKYLTFENITEDPWSGVTFDIDKNISISNVEYISYSIDDGSTWIKTLNENNRSISISIQNAPLNRVLFKGKAKQYGWYNESDYTDYFCNFYSNPFATPCFKVYGNIMSLFYEDNFINKKEFPEDSQKNCEGLFTSNKKIISAKNLILGDKETVLSSQCYFKMFYGCTNLIEPPKLPMLNLASSCYSNMFYGCTSLAISPGLPATVLINRCYYWMFYNTNVLPDTSNIDFTSSTIVGSGALRGLFAGTIVTYEDLCEILPLDENNKPCLPCTTLADSCYITMFQGCKSLTRALELPATKMAYQCYSEMFKGCTSLTTPPELPATTLAFLCYSNMFEGCTSLVTPPELLATTLSSNCYARMFLNCTSLTTAPDLPAVSLAGANACYRQMFEGCKNLTYVKAMFTTTPTDHLSNWLKDVSTNGTFIKNPNATWNVTGVSGVPSGWTVELAES